MKKLYPHVMKNARRNGKPDTVEQTVSGPMKREIRK
jgi:hypothetical protein